MVTQIDLDKTARGLVEDTSDQPAQYFRNTFYDACHDIRAGKVGRFDPSARLSNIFSVVSELPVTDTVTLTDTLKRAARQLSALQLKDVITFRTHTAAHAQRERLLKDVRQIIDPLRLKL